MTNLLETPQAGDYNVVYADPAWKFKLRGKRGADDRSPERHYVTMTVKEMAILPVREVVAKDCFCFMWTSGTYLQKAMALLGQWGFTYSTIVFTWVKLKPGMGTQAFMTEKDFTMGLGYSSRKNTEIVLLGRRGHPKRVAKNVRELIFAERREHSRKPDETRHRILQLAGDVPRLEMFAREQTEGWDAWGNEIDKYSGRGKLIVPQTVAEVMAERAANQVAPDDQDPTAVEAFLRRLAN